MSTFIIDGRTLNFEPGETIIQAALRQGIEIPHYCWHEGLSVAANCRMCLVEIKSDRPVKLPILAWNAASERYVSDTKVKLVPACFTPVTEAMEVFTHTDNVLKSVAAVQEFLLLNHPVDCPICDQAGECKLQDYWDKHQYRLKRKLTEPVHKPKAVFFGPHVIYDAERCISCTRCVRFCDEVARDHVLDERERGDRTEIVLSPGRELDHPYSLMTAHVCPVGALTARHFRFKARVWMLRSAMSICPGCARGCNCFIDYDPRQGRVYRLRPRKNMAINRYWMCDDGMLSYARIRDQRVLNGVIGNGQKARATPAEAIEAAAQALLKGDGKKVGVVLSAQHSCEDNFVLAQLAREALGTQRLYIAALGGWQGDAILRHTDNNPNRTGAVRIAGVTTGTVQNLLNDVSSGDVAAVVALGWASVEDVKELASLKKLPVMVSLSTHLGALTETASVVIPVACHAEMDGTFVNAQGIAQRFARAIEPPRGIQSAWETIGSLAKAMGKDLGLNQLSAVRQAMPALEAATP
jgi:NADH-quinone oxidoreductase subunit G